MAATGMAPQEANVAPARINPLDAHAKASPVAKIGMGIFGVVLVVGAIYIGREMIGDMADVHAPTILPYVLLGLALLVALGF